MRTIFTGRPRRSLKSLRRFFFFQAEDGIRDVAVTGVQTCALPISRPREKTICTVAQLAARHIVFSLGRAFRPALHFDPVAIFLAKLSRLRPRSDDPVALPRQEIGRASCRERV